jgi:hypothetical protein
VVLSGPELGQHFSQTRSNVVLDVIQVGERL